MATFRSSASFGKRQEYIAVAELLKKKFDVYMTLVDDQQIDCVVRLNADTYIDIQIKARSEDAKNPGVFTFEIKKPRWNYFFILYSEKTGCYWIIPSTDLAKLSNQRKSGKNAGGYRVVVTNTLASGVVKPRPKFDKYKNNFDLLKEAHA